MDSGAGSEASLARKESLGARAVIALVSLDPEALTAAFERYLSGGAYVTSQIRFAQLIVEHLTANGAMEVEGLNESPFTDSAPHGRTGSR